MKKLTTKEFIGKAIKIHKDRYDYSLVDYKNSYTKIRIICPKHGEFKQLPNNNTSKKQRCFKCFGNDRGPKQSFINKSKKIHQNKYGYSLVNYINNNTKIKIEYPKHGIFKQNPKEHMSGQGCSKCKNSKGETRIINYLENNNIEKIIDEKYDWEKI